MQSRRRFGFLAEEPLEPEASLNLQDGVDILSEMRFGSVAGQARMGHTRPLERGNMVVGRILTTEVRCKHKARRIGRLCLHSGLLFVALVSPLCHWLPDNGFPFLRGSLSNIAQIYFVMFAGQFAAGFSDKVVQLLDGRAFF